MKNDPPRRVIKVCCPLCGAFIRKLVTDCLRVSETCRTCVFREGQKHGQG